MPPDHHGPSVDDRGTSESEPPNQATDAAITIDSLSPAATETVRRFIAASTAKGGASPADVADLYTTPSVVGDHRATRYLDRRFVDGEMPADWRLLQDQLTEAQLDLAVGASGDELLAKLDQNVAARERRRSIFDDPDDLDEAEEDRNARLEHAAPTLDDLDVSSRVAVERQIIAEVLHYGIPPVEKMQLREELAATGDERSLQYLDLPFELAALPEDWEELRDHALRVRSVLESRGDDPSAALTRAVSARPDLAGRELLTLLEADTSRL